MIEKALLLFLPSYSPDLNPIEEAFCKVKCALRQMDKEAESRDDPEQLVLRAFSTITARDSKQWINDSGIYVLLIPYLLGCYSKYRKECEIIPRAQPEGLSHTVGVV